MCSRRCFPFLALLILLTAAGCQGRRNAFTLKGDIDALGNDTVYVCGNNEFFDRLEPVPARHGHFRFSFRPDTITPLWVLFPNGHTEFLFAEKRTETLLTGDSALAGHLTISGGVQNQLLTDFEAMLRDTVFTDAEIRQQVDSFILRHPFDDASVWLLQKYFVDVPSPDVPAIRSSIGHMSGNLQDNRFVTELRSRLSSYKPQNSGNVVGNFNVNDSTGRRVSTIQFGDSCVLITFWASWDEESRSRQREYRALVDSFAGRAFTLLSVSLDTDRDTWLRALSEDSLPATHANNFTGWNLDLLRLVGARDIPYNVLINPSRKIQAANLYGSELQTRIDRLLTEEEIRKEQEAKAAKEREKQMKKKKKR